jgi:L-asparaginase
MGKTQAVPLYPPGTTGIAGIYGQARKSQPMNNKHIAVLYTGGTIGMEKTVRGFAPMKDFDKVLNKLLRQQGNDLPGHTLHAYDNPIDSTNATPSDWQKIGRDIAARYDDYDGFVVLHGTDTMAYTAAALSFMLQGLRKPVIVTGSQIPLAAVRSDAAQNLITSLQLAASDALNEVAICFNQHLLRGNRASKVSAGRFTAFDTPNYPHLAEIGIAIRFNQAALLPRAAKENFELPDYPSGTVLPLRFTPGLPLCAVESMLLLNPQALILECYGAGNAPDREPGLRQALANANRNGTVIVACSQSPHGGVAIGTYAAGATLTEAGVIGAGDMCFEAIYTKLHHLLARGLRGDDLKKEFQRNLCGELSV